MLHLLGTVLLHWAALVGVASVVVHLRVFDRHSVMSVHILGYMSAISAVLVLACIANDIGDSGWFQLLRFVVFIAVPVLMTQRLYLLVKAQRTSRHSADKDPRD